MENVNPFVAQGYPSQQVIQSAPFSTMHLTNGEESSMISSCKAETTNFVPKDNNFTPPAFGMNKVAGNVAQGIQHTFEQDPFVNSTHDESNGKSKKLSPTATPFKPRQIIDTPNVDMHQSTQRTPKDRVFETPSESSAASGRTSKIIETPHTIHTTEGIFEYIYPSGEFASGRHTRFLSITGIPESLAMDAIQVLMKGKTHRAPSTVIEGRGPSHTILVAFSNIVDSVNAAGEIPNQHSTWSLDFINAREFSEVLLPGSKMYTSIHKGQLVVTATRHGPRNDFAQDDIIDCVVTIMKNYGSILAWEVLGVTHPHIRIRMEYYDLRDSERAKTSLDGSIFGPLQISVKDYAPDILEQSANIKHETVDTRTTTEDDLNTMVDALTFDKIGNSISDIPKTPFGYLQTPRSVFSPASDRTITTSTYLPTSGRLLTNPTPYTPTFLTPNGYVFTPTPSSAPTALGYPIASPGSFGFSNPPEMPLSAFRMPNRIKRPVKPNFLGGNNVVNLYRITQGQDVRTTIMLRNIPNKMPQADLKLFMDETNHGEYDFMYLRIDFANNCNVGYAFINFVDPLAIVKFVKARAGAKWQRYYSDKVAEISYATIQGKDCLIQKFRNSSVMLEDPSFRPKLFQVGLGPTAGMEETFPGPDNDSKLRRSIENAGAVGLFAPRAGQFFRESQRRRRSQFDRGTNLAQIEESVFIPGSEYSTHAPSHYSML